MAFLAVNYHPLFPSYSIASQATLSDPRILLMCIEVFRERRAVTIGYNSTIVPVCQRAELGVEEALNTFDCGRIWAILWSIV